MSETEKDVCLECGVEISDGGAWGYCVPCGNEVFDKLKETKMIDKIDWVGGLPDNTTELQQTKPQQTQLNLEENVMESITSATATATTINIPTTIKAPTVASSAMIVSLHRSVPDLVRNDPEASAALARLKSADPAAIKTKKHLIDCAEHNELQKLSRAIYRWHMDSTLPWGDLGARLIPNAKLLDYQAQMATYMNEFYDLKDKFLDVYPSHPAQAQVRLGDMFDESLYPSVYELDQKIKIRVEYEPIVDPEHFLVKLGDQAAQEMKSQYEDVLKRRMESAYSDVFARLREPLDNMSKMLDYGGNDKPSGFRDTLVSNVLKFVELMRACNVTGDAQMTKITNDLRAALDGVTPDMLRVSETQRLNTKQDIDKIIRQMPTLDF